MNLFQMHMLSVIGLILVIGFGYSEELPNSKIFNKSEFLKKINSARNSGINETDKFQTNHAKRNSQIDVLNDRDHSSQRNYDDRLPDKRAANERLYHRDHRDQDMYVRDFDASRDYRREESVNQKSHLHEGRHLESDRHSDHRNKHYSHDRLPHHREGGGREGGFHEHGHIVDEIRHDTKIYKSGERLDTDFPRGNNFDLLKGTSKYEVNERRHQGEMFEKDRRHHKYDHESRVMDKPFIININSDCGGPSKGRFVHKFVIKPQSHIPPINPNQHNPYKSIPSYQSPNNNYMSRQSVGSPMYYI